MDKCYYLESSLHFGSSPNFPCIIGAHFMKKVRIGIMRRTADQLTEQEKSAFAALYPDTQIEWVTLHSVDHLEHDQLCAEHNLDTVLLPKDLPIPSTAMKRGVAHVTLDRDGKVVKLAGMEVKFESFVPTPTTPS